MRQRIIQENLNWDELPFTEEVDPYYPTKMVSERVINQFNIYVHCRGIHRSFWKDILSLIWWISSLYSTWLRPEPPFFISFLYPLSSSPSFFPFPLLHTAQVVLPEKRMVITIEVVINNPLTPINNLLTPLLSLFQVWSSLSRWLGPWTSRRSIRPLHLRSFSSGMWKRRRTCFSNIHIIQCGEFSLIFFSPPAFFFSFSLHFLYFPLLLLLPCPSPFTFYLSIFFSFSLRYIWLLEWSNIMCNRFSFEEGRVVKTIAIKVCVHVCVRVRVRVRVYAYVCVCVCVCMCVVWHNS